VPDKHYLMKVPAERKGLLHNRFTGGGRRSPCLTRRTRARPVYLCRRRENRKGEAGHWGPVASALIP
jgi:hypothetical protein